MTTATHRRVLEAFLAALLPAQAFAGFEIAFTAPEAVPLCGEIELEVTVTNSGPDAVVVREPALDARSFEFQVRYGEHRLSRYTAYTPGAHQPSTLAGQDLEKGASLSFRHAVPAVAAGDWTFVAVWNGAGTAVESAPRVVRVAAQGESREALLRLVTDAGTMDAALWPDVAPATCLHVARLARQGFYDGTTFHRVIPNFMIQGGDPRGTGEGGPGYTIQAELSDRAHEAGVLSMARLGDPGEQFGQKPADRFVNTAGSQFFIMHAAQRALDGRYTAFGRLTTGLEVVDAIAQAPAEAESPESPVTPVVIRKAQLVPGSSS